MRELSTKVPRTSIWWSRVQALGLTVLLAAICVIHWWVQRQGRHWSHALRQRSMVTAPVRRPLVRLHPQGGPELPSSDAVRIHKLSLVEDGLETVERVEYIESGIRVSKGCYMYRRRPVTIVDRVPRLHALPDPHPAPRLWLHMWQTRKVEPMVLVRLGEPEAYPHEFLPVIGAWHLYGSVPGGRADMYLASRIVIYDRERLEYYTRLRTTECRRGP